MPKETIEAFQDHGEIRGITLEEDLDGARQLFADLAQAGIDYDDVIRVLEEEGVQKFIDSFEDLIEGIAAKKGVLVSA
jgi:transaldolase